MLRFWNDQDVKWKKRWGTKQWAANMRKQRSLCIAIQAGLSPCIEPIEGSKGNPMSKVAIETLAWKGCNPSFTPPLTTVDYTHCPNAVLHVLKEHFGQLDTPRCQWFRLYNDDGGLAVNMESRVESPSGPLSSELPPRSFLSKYASCMPSWLRSFKAWETTQKCD